MDKVSLGCFEALINCLLWRVLLWKQRTYRPRRSCLKKCYVHPFFVMFADFLVRLRSMWVVQCCWQAWCPAFVQIEIIHTLPWRNWAEILWSWKKEDCNHHHLMAFCRFEIPRRWSNHFLLSSLSHRQNPKIRFSPSSSCMHDFSFWYPSHFDVKVALKMPSSSYESGNIFIFIFFHPNYCVEKTKVARSRSKSVKCEMFISKSNSSSMMHCALHNCGSSSSSTKNTAFPVHFSKKFPSPGLLTVDFQSTFWVMPIIKCDVGQ